MTVLKAIAAALMLPLLLAACAQEGDDRPLIQRLAPNTYAGFQDGGVVGGAQAFTGQVKLLCETLDGTEFVIAVDALAAATGTDELKDRVRAYRRETCEQNAAFAGVADLIANPVSRAEPVVEVVPAESAAPAATEPPAPKPAAVAESAS